MGKRRGRDWQAFSKITKVVICLSVIIQAGYFAIEILGNVPNSDRKKKVAGARGGF